MNKKAKSILLVGGTGYLGQHLISYLNNEYEIVTSGTKNGCHSNNHVVIDFMSPATFSNLPDQPFDIVIFLAASIKGLNTNDLLHQDMETNVYNFSKFLQFIIDKKYAKKIVYISSMTVYSQNATSPVTETAETSPIHTYGLSKLLAEQLIDFTCKRHDISGLIFRLPGIYGGNKKSGYIYNIANQLKNNENIDIDTTGLGFWETMEVNDLCELITRAINVSVWKKSCDIYNISYGIPIDFVQTAYTIKKMLNSKSLITIKKPLGYTAFFMDNKKLKHLVQSDANFELSLLKYVTSI